jgi:hypothetical protein
VGGRNLCQAQGHERGQGGEKWIELDLICQA